MVGGGPDEVARMVAECLAAGPRRPKPLCAPFTYYAHPRPKRPGPQGPLVLKGAAPAAEPTSVPPDCSPSLAKPCSPQEATNRQPPEASTFPDGQHLGRQPARLEPIPPKCLRYVDVAKTVTMVHRIPSESGTVDGSQMYRSVMLDPGAEMAALRSCSFTSSPRVSLMEPPRTPEDALAPVARSWSFTPVGAARSARLVAMGCPAPPKLLSRLWSFGKGGMPSAVIGEELRFVQEGREHRMDAPAISDYEQNQSPDVLEVNGLAEPYFEEPGVADAAGDQSEDQ
eukprot:evm.model.scf_1478.4 EVM.evm.TU.scf_1478.4   scf_1478:16667-18305(+)